MLGASGGVGQHLVRLASAAGHEVTAVSRAALDVPAGVKVAVGDVSREDFLGEQLEGQAAVLSALGLRRRNQGNPYSPLTSPADFTSASARALVSAMKRRGVRRVVAVSAAGVGDSRAGLNFLMRFFIATSTVGANYRDLEAMEAVYAASGLDWCCVRPTGLTDGPETRRVVERRDFPLTARISKADVAWWMVEHLATAPSRTPLISGG